jgi:hypothetical protein
MGGIANVKLGAPGGHPDSARALGPSSGETSNPGIEAPEADRSRQFQELNRLLNEGIITQEEFERARQKLPTD